MGLQIKEDWAGLTIHAYNPSCSAAEAGWQVHKILSQNKRHSVKGVEGIAP